MPLDEKCAMPVLPTLRKEIAHPPSQGAVQRILRIEVSLIVKLAERKLSMAEVMALGVGRTIEFGNACDEPLELRINNKVIATGEAVMVGEKFGLRITRIDDVQSVIRSMGAEGS